VLCSHFAVGRLSPAEAWLPRLPRLPRLAERLNLRQTYSAIIAVCLEEVVEEVVEEVEEVVEEDEAEEEDSGER